MTVMRWALLCESATQRPDNLVDLVGAGGDRLEVDLPFSGTAVIVYSAEFESEHAESMSSAVIAFVGPDQQVISQLDGQIMPSFDGGLVSTSVVTYPFTVSSEGRHLFIVWIADEPLAALPLDIVQST